MNMAVHIVGTAARTPLGFTAETTAAAYRAGVSRLAAHPFMVDDGGDNILSAIDGELDAALLGWRRLEFLATAAFAEIHAKIERVLPRIRVLPVIVAMPETRPGFTEHNRRKLLEALQCRVDPPGIVERCESGHAGGLYALRLAVHRVQAGGCDLCLAGGVDGYLHPDTIDWLQTHRQLSGRETRGGFAPGEAAGFVAVASDAFVRSAGLESLAVIRGTGQGMERHVIKTDSINLGEGLTQAIAEATKSLSLPEEAVESVYNDINGERYRSEEWGFSILRSPGVLRDLSYSAPADCWGDVGAASGPLFLSLAIQAWRRGYANGPRALLWAGSEGGLRMASVLQSTRLGA
jgi:3-oxoacyl-[acyl-carrier-protein] synthase-1